jgi:hypothetical protein
MDKCPVVLWRTFIHLISTSIESPNGDDATKDLLWINSVNFGTVYDYLCFDTRVDFLLFRIMGRFADPSGRMV